MQILRCAPRHTQVEKSGSTAPHRGCGSEDPYVAGRALSSAGRLTLVKVTLSAIPIHIAIATAISPWVIRAIDRKRRAFLWQGSETVQGGHCLVAWKQVCSPTEFGGLDIKDLTMFGYALRLRWEWLRQVDPNKIWADLPCSVEAPVRDFFKASFLVTVGNGTRAFFWTDRWLDGQSIELLFPHLWHAVARRARNRRTVAEALAEHHWVRDIKGALTAHVLAEFLQL
jgi:hypothetical protein